MKMFVFICALFQVVALTSFAQDPDVLIFSFQKQKNPDELRSAIDELKPYLEKETGKKIEVIVPTSYGVTAQSLISKKVHIAYMDSLPYILASQEANLEVITVEKRNGRTEYDSLVVVPKSSPAKTIADLKGKKMAFTSQTSTSGYLFPLSKLVAEKQIENATKTDQFFSQVIYAGGYDKALLAVASGQVDAAAFSDYALEGPKSDLYGTAETREKVKILARIPGVPTHLIAVQKDLSAELRKKIQNALLKISKEKPELLKSVYGAAELVKPPSKNHVDKTQKALKATGLEATTFVK